MPTDIFAHRYIDKPVWSDYGEQEWRLLNQAFDIITEALPCYTPEGEVNEANQGKWKKLHDFLAHELGVDKLSTRDDSWSSVCEHFVNAQYTGQYDADRFIKERFSLIEIAMRLREEEIAHTNSQLGIEILEANMRDVRRLGLTCQSPVSELRGPGSGEEEITARNEKMNSEFNDQVAGLNELFRCAKVPLIYCNGFIQTCTSQKRAFNPAVPR